MNSKIRVALICGGKSAEHEVSLLSTINIYNSIDRERFDVVILSIDKDGVWYCSNPDDFVVFSHNPSVIALEKSTAIITIRPDKDSTKFLCVDDGYSIGPIDVVFPILHGPYGEDGSIQGMLKLLNLPCVGVSVLGSAVGMDKEIMKRLLRDAGIATARFISIKESNRQTLQFHTVKELLGIPFFVKPSNLGSSVGISKVSNPMSFSAAIAEAFQYDKKILCEEFIEGRQIECGVLGNDEPVVSVPGEIITNKRKYEFYSYTAKYIDESGAILSIPARLPIDICKKVQDLSLKTFSSLYCEGMACVELFLKSSGEIYVNEINTIPGFTKTSMYPRLFEANGVSCRELITRLIMLALERFEKDKKIKTYRET
ncbi:MAG: D-alanine--D-alanine ligase [Chitinivibrionales bacterium]|nr:D-alanine--D-alanine ligase [Chitinivibrionales bacterium]